MNFDEQTLSVVAASCCVLILAVTGGFLISILWSITGELISRLRTKPAIQGDEEE